MGTPMSLVCFLVDYISTILGPEFPEHSAPYDPCVQAGGCMEIFMIKTGFYDK